MKKDPNRVPTVYCLFEVVRPVAAAGPRGMKLFSEGRTEQDALHEANQLSSARFDPEARWSGAMTRDKP